MLCLGRCLMAWVRHHLNGNDKHVHVDMSGKSCSDYTPEIPRYIYTFVIIYTRNQQGLKLNLEVGELFLFSTLWKRNTVWRTYFYSFHFYTFFYFTELSDAPIFRAQCSRLDVLTRHCYEYKWRGGIFLYETFFDATARMCCHFTASGSLDSSWAWVTLKIWINWAFIILKI